MKYIYCWIAVLGFAAFAPAQSIPNLPLPLGAGTAEVWNDRIYFFGGTNHWNGSILYPRVYRSDGVSWALHDSIPDYNLWDVESVLVGDDVYLIGGWPAGAISLRRYSLASGSWQTLADSPNLSQTWGMTAEHIGGTIYLFNSSGQVFAYDIASNSWSTRTSSGVSTSYDVNSVLYQGEIYVLGFQNSGFYKYNPTSDHWTQLADAPYAVGACAMGIVNDLIYCVGGNYNGSNTATYRSGIIYDTNTSTWEVNNHQLSGRRHWMASAEFRGGFYVLGGIDSTAWAVSIVEEIVPQGTVQGLSRIQEPSANVFYLAQNYPNPFNPATNIEYALPRGSFVTLEVFDLLGQKVASLVNDYQPAGSYRYQFEGTGLASGIYLYRLNAGPFFLTRKMFLMQ